MNSITPIQQRHSGKPGFPLRLFAAAFMISLLTGVFGGWQAWQMRNRFTREGGGVRLLRIVRIQAYQ